MHVKHESIIVPMKKNISRISFIVHQKQIFNVFDNLICGISGGQDSLLVVLILYHLKHLYNFELTLIYCNHFWQVKNFYIVLQLLKIAYLLNSPIHINVPKNKLNSEQAGHFWRKKEFSQTLNYCQANRLLLGHTLNDQIETALWHFLRGTSPKGLLALKSTSYFQTNQVSHSIINLTVCHEKNPQQKFLLQNTISKTAKKSIFFTKQIILNSEDLSINLENEQNKSRFILINTKNTNYYLYNSKKINQQGPQLKRPLLNLSRSTVTKIIKTNKLPIINDNTNQSKKLMRNKMRLILIPLFHYYIHNLSENNIKKYINISEEEQKYLDQLTKKLIGDYCNYPVFIKSLKFLPIGIQRLCIRKLLEKYTLKQFTLKHIEKMESLF